MDSLSGRRHMLDYAWLRNVRNTFDLFQRGWNNWVVAFGSDTQSRLFSRFGWDFLDSSRLVIALIVGILVMSTAVFLLLPLVLKFRSARQKDPLLRLWHRFTRKLTKAGLVVHPSMGPRELATSAGSQLTESQLFSAQESINRIAELYLLCRYSQQAGKQQELTELISSFRLRPVSH